jgi:hypothetical protein
MGAVCAEVLSGPRANLSTESESLIRFQRVRSDVRFRLLAGVRAECGACGLSTLQGDNAMIALIHCVAGIKDETLQTIRVNAAWELFLIWINAWCCVVCAV